MTDALEGLPAPPVPDDCDLGAFDWFPLKHKRLIRSAWWLSASDLARSRSVDLWIEAYQQVPAASLPDNDAELARFAGFGRDVEAWLRHAEEIMQPWTRCSDGRWYHPTLAEVAREAHDRRVKERAKKRRQRGMSPGTTSKVAPLGKRAQDPAKSAPLSDVSPGTSLHRTRQDKTGKKENSNGGGVGESSAAPLKTSRTKAKGQRGTRIPFGFHPGAPGIDFARTEGFTDDGAIWAIVAEFTDYWRAQPGQKGVKLDWPATWRNWVRKEAKRIGERHGRARSNGNGTGLGRTAAQERVGRMYEGAVAALERRR